MAFVGKADDGTWIFFLVLQVELASLRLCLSIIKCFFYKIALHITNIADIDFSDGSLMLPT